MKPIEIDCEGNAVNGETLIHWTPDNEFAKKMFAAAKEARKPKNLAASIWENYLFDLSAEQFLEFLKELQKISMKAKGE